VSFRLLPSAPSRLWIKYPTNRKCRNAAAITASSIELVGCALLFAALAFLAV
jgi:hypothetical protein